MAAGDEVRELLVEQLRLMLGPMLEQLRTPNTAENAVEVYCDVVAGVVLAVLRPNLGLGDEERAIMLRELDLIERDVSEFEGAELRRWIAERVMVLRAIAGQGEGGSATAESGDRGAQ